MIRKNSKRQQTKNSLKRNLRARLQIETLEDRKLLTVDVAPLFDINAIVQSSNPSELIEVGGTVYFAATTDEHGAELWKSDGTSTGTVLVKDIRTGTQPSSPANLVNVNGTLYFRATDGVSGQELWKSDGTAAGTVMVKDIWSGGDSFPQYLTNVGGTLFFRANDGINGQELWKSDGTAAGTMLVKNLSSGASNSAPARLTNVGGTLYFVATDSIKGIELWKSNGTDAGTVIVKDIVTGTNGSTPVHLTNVAGTLYFGATTAPNGTELWKSDGTDAGTVLVRDINPGSASSSLNGLTSNGTSLFFTAYTASSGYQLWKSDGTNAGTIIVKSILPFGGSGIGQVTNVNGTIFFEARDSLNGYELWKSDGTATGTVLVKDISPGVFSSNSRSLTNINGTLYFRAKTEATGYELWKSDGTTNGTVQVKEIRVGAESSSPILMTNVNGTVFFKANDGTTGLELWKSDGTSSGTTIVRDIMDKGTSSNPFQLANLNGKLLFKASDGLLGSELWSSTGVANGTTLVKDINVGFNNSEPSKIVNVGGIAYFSAFTQTNGQELWKSDGTGGGTALVSDIIAGTASGTPQILTNVNGTLFFSAITSAAGQELWKSDGTAAGTVLVKDIRPGANGSGPSSLINVNGTLYFTATDGVNGNELWKSDGSAAGTVMVRDVRGGATGAYPFGLTNLNGVVYFSADDAVAGRELWKSDGTSTGTVLVKDIIVGGTGSGPSNLSVFGGEVYFSANGGASVGIELWKSDGTSSGTVLVKDIFSGGGGSSPSWLTTAGTNLYFAASTSTQGIEIWKTDGTSAGTVLVKDIYTGATGSSPSYLTQLGGTLYFRANDGINGQEVWKTDGTTTGTNLVLNVARESQSSNPHSLTAVGSKLFFVATTQLYGTELYVVEEAPTVPTSILLSSNTVAENTPIGTTFSELSTVGSQLASTTFEIVSDASSSSFVIEDNLLKTAATLDYEATSYYSIQIRATSGGVSITRDISIFVSPVNEFDPQLTSPTEYSVAENSVNVGTLTATDADLPQVSFTYTIVGGVDASRFSIVGNTVVFQAIPNFENPTDTDGNNSYIVQVSASDGVRSQTKTLTVTVTDTNEAPVNLLLSNDSFPESLAAGSLVSHLAAFDVDGPAPLSFAFSPVFPNDNSGFEIVGNQLRTTREFSYDDLADRQLLVRIVALDGLLASSLPATFVIDVTQAAKPPVAQDLSYAVDQGTSASITLSGNDAEFVYTITQAPAHGALSGIAPNLAYTPNSGFVGEDTFFYTVKKGSLTSYEARVTLTVVGVLPTVNFSVQQSQTSESLVTHAIFVQLDVAAVNDLIVPVSALAGGTAIAESDFALPPGIVIPRGATSGSMTIGIADDTIHEGTETFTVRLNSSPLYTLGTIATHQVTLADNDSPPTLSLEKTSETVGEASTSVSVRLRLSAPAAQDVAVPFTLLAETTTVNVDFNLTGGSQFPSGGNYLLIPAGASSANLTINVLDDEIIEQSELLKIRFDEPTYSSFANPNATTFALAIRDNDERTVVMNRSLDQVSEARGSYTVVARTDRPFTQTTTVPISFGGTAISTSLGRDYSIASPGAFVFAANQSTATLVLQITDDSSAERNDDIIVRLQDDSPSYRLGSTSQTAITIVDNDTALISFETAATSLWENAGNYTVRVTLSRVAAESVTVPLVLASGAGYATKGSDYNFSVVSVTIPAGQTSATATLQILPDNFNEADELVRISFGSLPSGTPVRIGTNASTSITIRDDDPILSIRPLKATVAETGVAEFELSLSAITHNAVVANVYLSGNATLNSDYVRAFNYTAALGGIVPNGPTEINLPVLAIFPPLIKSIIYRLPIGNDTVFESTETITATVALTTTTALPSRSAMSASVSILDDDANAVTFQTANGSMSETIEGKKIRIYTATVQMAQTASRDIQVALAFSGTAKYGVDYRIHDVDARSGLTIRKGFKTSTFRIEVISDSTFEGNETVLVSIIAVTSPGVLPRPTATRKFTIVDDDSPPTSLGFRYDDDFNPEAIARWRASIVEPNQALVIAGTVAVQSAPKVGAFSGDVPNLSSAQKAALRDSNGKALPADVILPPGVVALVVASGSKGPVDGAVAFFDINFNGVLDFIDSDNDGILDDGEISETPAVTAADGSFAFYLDNFDANNDGVVSTSEGRLVLAGGTDISTGLVGLIPLTAPVGLFNVTPLSTITESLVRKHGLSVLDAMNRTTQAFDIENYSLAEGISLYQVLENDALAAQAYSAHVQIYSVAVGLAQYLTGVSALSGNSSRDVGALGSIIFDELADFISTEGSTLDLSNAEVIAQIAQTVAREQEIGELNSESLSAAADAISNGILELRKTTLTSDTAGAGEAFLASIYQAKKVAQGTLPEDLRLLGAGQKTVAAINSTYTTSNIASLVAVQVATVTVPPLVEIDSLGIVEGNSGQLTLVFSATLAGNHDYPVSVDFSTADGSAVATTPELIGDYQSHSGTLTWAANETGATGIKYIHVPIEADTVFEADEFFRVLLSNPSRLVIRQGEGRGYIHNDDAFHFSTTAVPGQTVNELLLTLSDGITQVNDNDTEILNGLLVTPVQSHLAGQMNVADTWRIDFSENRYRADTWSFDGKSGATDEIHIQAGVFSDLNYTISSANSSTLTLMSDSVVGQLELHSVDVESSKLFVSEMKQLIVHLPSGIASIIIEDADANESGRMRIRSATNAFAPIEFTNPTTSIRIVRASSNTSVTELSRDSAFAGTIDLGFTDVTPPVSVVNAMPASATSLHIPVSVTGSDPVGTEGSPTGVKEYDLYVAQDSGPFTKFATVPAGSPSTTFAATSNHTYFFRSVARDNAGNEEFEPALLEDTLTRTGDLDKPVSAVSEAVAGGLGRFLVMMSGSDTGGSRLGRFDLYVSIDGQTPTLVGSPSAGTANNVGVYATSFEYQGIVDGNTYQYRFFTRAVDTVGNTEDTPDAPADIVTTARFDPPNNTTPTPTGIVVQQGANQRSFIQTVAIAFTSTNLLSDWFRTEYVEIQKFAISATDLSTGATLLSPSQIAVHGNQLNINFGPNGVGNSKTTIAGDGYFRIRLDLDRDGIFGENEDAHFDFHRLLGDADGDGKVSALDTAVVDSLMGRLGANLDGDLNGSQKVDVTDRSYTTRQRGRSIAILNPSPAP